jgi:L-amino acid N-acyltransferase YncA
VPVRIATRADLPAIQAIYEAAILQSTATLDLEPMRGEEQEVWFRSFGTLDPLVVEEEGTTIRGFAYYTAYKTRPGYVHTKEISVYVDEMHRHQGVGTALYHDLIRRARSSGVHALVATLSGPNEASEALHRRYGFERIGSLPEAGFKFGRFLDVTLWHRLL